MKKAAGLDFLGERLLVVRVHPHAIDVQYEVKEHLRTDGRVCWCILRWPLLASVSILRGALHNYESATSRHDHETRDKGVTERGKPCNAASG